MDRRNALKTMAAATAGAVITPGAASCCCGTVIGTVEFLPIVIETEMVKYHITWKDGTIFEGEAPECAIDKLVEDLLSNKWPFSYERKKGSCVITLL